uniref:Glycosyltransferase 2-like domain-containing protein n=1 Tax=viral metagenome TaxID=1070528 RepID=A0A6M3JML2_9ZZZZ
MGIVGCICAFESEATIGRTIKSLDGVVDRIILVDGSWEGFADYPCSKDQTITIAYNATVPTIVVKNGTGKPYSSEMTKRNMYLAEGLVDSGEWLLIIDDDEYVTQGGPQLRKYLLSSECQSQHHSVVVWKRNTHDPDSWLRMGEYVRLFRYIPKMHYGVNPWTIEIPNAPSLPIVSELTPIPLHIANDQETKGQKYLEMKDEARIKGCFGKVDVSPKVEKIVESNSAEKPKRKRGRPRKIQ